MDFDFTESAGPMESMDLDKIDFDSLPEEVLEVFFESAFTGVAEMKKAIEEDREMKLGMIEKLSDEQANEIIKFYSQLKDIFIEWELYEQCVDIAYIIDETEKGRNILRKNYEE